MGDLPENWVETTIGELYDFIGGGTPSKSIASYWNGNIPWASIKDISQIKVLEETQDFISELGLKNSAANVAQVGDVILGTRMLPGKTVLTNIITAINQDLKIVKPKTDIPSKFTVYQFSFLKDEFLSRSGGTTVQGITIEKINEIPFLLPPPPEQKRIVAKLDKLFAHLDQLKARLDQVPVLLKQFRQAVLTQAVTGKLTEEWRNDDTWQNLSVSDLSLKIQYGYTAKSSFEFGNAKYLRITDIQDNKVDWESVPLCEISETELVKYQLKKNDIVFARTGATVGKSFLIESDVKDIVFASYLIRISLIEGISAKYIWFYFNSPTYWKAIGESAAGIAQPNVNGQILGSLVVPIPDLTEQKEIVRRVETLFVIADKIEASYNKLKEKIDHLPQAILAKAFRGELVHAEEIIYETIH